MKGGEKRKWNKGMERGRKDGDEEGKNKVKEEKRGEGTSLNSLRAMMKY